MEGRISREREEGVQMRMDVATRAQPKCKRAVRDSRETFLKRKQFSEGGRVGGECANASISRNIGVQHRRGAVEDWSGFRLVRAEPKGEVLKKSMRQEGGWG